ncbi:MAG: DUF4268 domain-containing protein [Chloroflexota bacterium]|nr:DUF4268 domain-containing protein [Chloroflexota bacterium]MDQ5864669.1 DUF4268 domain-containing protein [Chloroflexota bacterium]
MTDAGNTIQKLEIVPLRQAFPHEALHFTVWLEANIDALTDRLGIKLTDIQREQAVGDFSVDLVGQGADGRRVIIENQLERTDHSHLGQLLTYLVNLDASIAIWVASETRAEHAKVINWLNESTPADISFYLVKVEAARIGTSPYAPLFTVLARPDIQTKEIGEKKKEWAERHFSRYEFWKGLLEKSKAKTKLFANISPGKDSWISTGSGKTGIGFIYHIRLGEGTVELYIDYDQNTGEKNKQIFDILYSQKDVIEQEFGDSLEWDRNNSKRVSQIRKRFNNGGLALPDTWSNLQDEMIDAMVRFDRIFRPRIAQIKI